MTVVRILLAIVLIAYFIVGVIVFGDISPLVFIPLFVFFIVFTFKAKEEREEILEALEQLKDEIAVLKKDQSIEQLGDETKETENKG